MEVISKLQLQILSFGRYIAQYQRSAPTRLPVVLLFVSLFIGLGQSVANAAGTAAQVNFQPSGAAIPAGYVVDSGNTFASRGNGFSYGWNVDMTGKTRERSHNADQRLNTFVFENNNNTRTWELAVDNGEYQVTVSMGDAQWQSNDNRMTVESTLYWNNTTLAANTFKSDTKTVVVSDGRLTLQSHGMLNYVDVVPVNFAVAGEISGTVFNDLSYDGQPDSGEPGMDGVGVTVTDADGNSAAATTSGGGVYAIQTTDGAPAALSGAVRLEFTLPNGTFDGWEPSVGGGTSVQFADITAGAVANIGYHEPLNYAQPNPPLATVRLVNGNTDRSTEGTLLTFPYNSSGSNSSGSNLNTNATTTLATNTQIGSVWGLAYARNTRKIYTAAFLKRHAGLISTQGNALGNIWVTDLNSNATTQFINLSPTLNVGSMVDDNSRGITGGVGDPSTDAPAYAQIAKVGLGDLDISLDESTLYTVNLNTRELVTIDIASAAIASTPIPDPGCVGGEWRPFALEIQPGNVYIGGVCDAGSSSTANLTAVVYKYDGSTFQTVLTAPLNYSKGNLWDDTGGNIPWNSWNDTELADADDHAYPQPVLSDIEFDVNGDMILAFFDRYGHQTGHRNSNTSGSVPNTGEKVAGGDILRACLDGAGAYQLESNGVCGGVTGAGAGNGQGPGGGEFYDDVFTSAGSSRHEETSNGALAILPGSDEIVLMSMDPNNSTGSGTPDELAFRAGGPAWFSNSGSDAGQKVRGFQVFNQRNYYDNANRTFAKGHGVGDIELLIDPAPIEVGNRVWEDADANGTQDPGEPALQGVEVQLYDSADTLLATATTDDAGNYFFSSAASGSQTGSHAVYNISGLTPDTAGFEVRIANAEGASQQASLANLYITTPDADSDTRDSDARRRGTTAIVSFATGTGGQNKHHYDMGFSRVQPLPEAILTIIKQVSGATSAESFAITISGGSPATDTGISLTHGQTETLTVTPGTYNITEQGPLPEPPAGYRWQSPTYSEQSVELANGETATVTVSNTLIPVESATGTLTVTKTVNWNGNPPNAGQQFSYSIAGSNGFTTINDTITDGATKTYDVPLGTYTVTETSPGSGWTATYTVDGAANSTSGIVTLGDNTTPAPVSAAAISGTVFRDFGSDGVLSSGTITDIGLAGVTVTAYDPSNAAVGSTQTIADGTYSLTPTADGPWRIEFTDLPEGYEPSAMGSGNDSVQFVAGSGATGVDFAVNRASDYAQANPTIAMPTYINGDASTAMRGMVRMNWDASGNFTQIASQADIGSTWGVAYQRDTKQLFASAVVKRHSGLGAQGLGGIYTITNPASATPASGLFLDLDAAPFNINFGTLPVNGAGGRGLGATTTDPYADPLAFAAAGTQGMGDIDLSDDGNSLWVVNLFAETGGLGSLIRLDVTGGVAPASAEIFPLADMAGVPACTGGTLRPWALTIEGGVGYLGAVCSAETSLNRADLAAYVLSFDPETPTTLTTVLSTDLSFTKGASHNGNEGAPHLANLWHPWRNTLTTPAPGGGWPGAVEENESPAPVLADIEFDEHGAMILGFLDRRGMQWGGVYIRSDGSVPGSLVNTAGDIMRACPDANGDYILENAGTCGGVTGGGAGTNEGPGNGEFYRDNGINGVQDTRNHEDPPTGGLAVLLGSNEVASSTMDPDGRWWSGGTIWFSNGNGARLRAEQVYAADANYGSVIQTFAKSIGQGDIEIITDPAPIEIGNRVWDDRDGDGIQDAGEPGINGLTVSLASAGGTLTTTTSGDGHYSFAVDPQTAYTLTVATPADYVLTQSNADAADGISYSNNDNISDVRDNDAVLVSGVPTISYTTGSAGQNNHGLDFGFVKPGTGQVDINNTAPEEVKVDLELTKTVDNANPVRGAIVTFTLTASNNSANDATGVQASDVLPAGLSYDAHTGEGTYTPATGVWDIGNLDANQSKVLNISVTVD